MRKRFPEYFYKPDIKKMWKTAIFVPDTNVLLDIFRFPPASSKGLLKILKHLKDQDRLWIPYQFAHEYLKELPRIKYDIQEDDKKRMKVLNQWIKNVVDELNEFDDLTDYELGGKITKIESIFKAIRGGLREHRKKHKERLDTEDLKGEIAKLFADRISAPYNDQKLAEIYGEGEWRYKMRRPPGFKDENKPVSQRYGDLIGWLQIIEFVDRQDTKQPIIMITRDSSGDDWFYKPEVHKDEVAPRPELVKEMRNKAGVDFYLYQTGEFMELANKHLELDKPITDTAIKEARNRAKRALLRLDMTLAELRVGMLGMMLAELESRPRSVDSILEKERLEQFYEDMYGMPFRSLTSDDDTMEPPSPVDDIPF